MSAFNYDKDIVSSYKDNFELEKNNFKNSSLNTYRYGYLKTCTDSLVSKMASNLDGLFGKIENGYTNINNYWTEYQDASDSLESSFQSFSASCSDPVVNSYLSGFIDKIKDNYYVPDNSALTFEDYYKNIKIDNTGKVTITMGNEGLTKFEKEFKNWCESQGKDVEVVCYTVDENGKYNLTIANPELKEKENELIKKCSEEGIKIRITEDTRTVDKQNDCYDNGTSKVKGDEYGSDHQWGIAFDIYVEGENGENTYDDPKYTDDWNKVGEIGKEIGLEWGGDWETFTDKPHFSLKDYDTKTLKTEYDNPGEFSDTWDKDSY